MKVSVKIDTIELDYDDTPLSGSSGEIYHNRCIEVVALLCDKALALFTAERDRK